ncbi:unnamed protein product [Microthlaspi erraticum]|uniref:Uncharacterized protein n=1 Tax=Microthlaspi erraticum TaxID=1685480 RepID=A0A6D2KWR2_9BRAS|nr:unnamed protein product [Microthlaspi erraticum]
MLLVQESKQRPLRPWDKHKKTHLDPKERNTVLNDSFIGQVTKWNSLEIDLTRRIGSDGIPANEELFGSGKYGGGDALSGGLNGGD